MKSEHFAENPTNLDQLIRSRFGGEAFSRAETTLTQLDMPKHKRNGAYADSPNHRGLLSLATAFACIDAVASDLAKLPIYLYEVSNKGKKEVKSHPITHILNQEMNQDASAFKTKRTVFAHCVGLGNGYFEIVRDNYRDEVVEMHPLDPSKMTVESVNKKIVYKFGSKPIESNDVVHVAGLGYDGVKGYSPVSLFRRSLSISIDAESYGASFFSNSADPRGFYKFPQQFSPEAYARLKQTLITDRQGVENSNTPVILEEGGEFVPINMSLQDVLFLETRQLGAIEICKMFRVPPPLVQELENAHFQNLSQLGKFYVSGTLEPRCVDFLQEVARKVFSPEDRRRYRLEADFSKWTQESAADRSGYYQKMSGIGVFSVDEIRESEGYSPIGGTEGTARFFPLNFGNLKLIAEGGNLKSEPSKQPSNDEPVKDEQING